LKRLLVATRSRHKLSEIRELLAEHAGIHLLDLNDAGIAESPDEDAIEIFDTFAENAIAKARYFAAKSGLPVLADDSGLCVDALDGAPGVRSKRFAGFSGEDGDTDSANNAHLLRLMQGLPPQRRAAHYVCVLALLENDGTERIFEGRCDGAILTRPRGSGGFGYDPLFLASGHDRTFGEMSAEEKNALSHRARALQDAAEYLRTLNPGKQ
jgi:XTP/dITP diphosphohydrolase